VKTPPPQKPHDPPEEIQRLRTVVDELKLLNEIAMESSGAGSLEEILKTIIDRSLKVVNAEQGSIVLVTDDAGTSLKTFIRQDNLSSLRHSYHVGTHIIGSVLYTREPLLVQDLAADGRFETTEQDRAEIRSVLCAPIINRGRLVGVFMMVNKKLGRSFTEDDLRLLMILSAQAGQLISNAQLQEETIQKKEELALARIESEKWRELDDLKSRFFAEISHEFRAPLTLILGPVEGLLAGRREGDPREDYQLIRRNAHRLLRLINDVLDLSRLEARSLKLRVAEGDLLPVIRPIVGSFQPLADQCGITLRFSASSPEIRGYFDREKLETVVYNLVSNALKFTPPKGTVVVEVTFADPGPGGIRWASVTVADNGRGIPADKLGHLFDRYYQVADEDRHSGSGLGLALSRGLVHLHHGTITVTSSEHDGSSFVVRVPVDPQAFAPEELVEAQDPDHWLNPDSPPETVPGRSKSPAAIEPSAPLLPLMLIVEDDPELRRYLCDNLKKFFRIYEASDGEIGLSIARDVVPDIVISDISMPVMDGIQLCRSLKTDERTSHVPVLLLTAMASRETQLAGLDIGADEYISKPFSWEELVARAQNLVENRKKLRERFSRILPLTPSELGVTSMDEAFLTKVMASIESSMGNESFGVEDLAEDVAMSYSHLHRKLTALLNQSPNQLIRSVRLRRAKELLERDAGTISEIAYTVGFGSPAYLTKCFHEQFGIVPSQARKKPAAPSPGT
jgi:signal transduction histidine kinase/DNA-binding response OmpR family regulator